MAYTRLRERKDGSKFYEITSSRKRGQSAKVMRWNVPEGWSQRAIVRELQKVAAEFDRQFVAGEILSRSEKKALEKKRQEAEAKRLTVKKYALVFYIPQKKRECSMRTVEYYQNILDRYIFPAISDEKIEDIAWTDCKRILDHAQDKGLSYATRHGIYITLSQVFGSALNDSVIKANPLAGRKMPRRQKDDRKPTMEVFSPEELKTVLQALETEPLKWRAFFCLLLDTGARRGEICAIKWNSIDWEGEAISIDGNIVETDTEWKEAAPKNGHARVVYPSKETLHLLRLYRLQAGHSEYVFSRSDIENAPVLPRSVSQYMRKLAKKYNFSFKCNPHKFRHTFATYALSGGADIAAVSRALGHSQISTTLNFYAHPSEEQARQASRILQETLKRA